ncbi:MAG: hypothetical protein KDC12_06695 [Flavobacteriales bacterium]|nr:hypothetical protein [Flavobacteriales bacterium]
MKTLKFILLFLLIPMTQMVAQVPQYIKYQSVIRNTAGEPMANTAVSVQLTILENNADVYQETHSVTTNAFGLVNLDLGDGSTSDNFSAITWDQGTYDLQVAVDPNGGSNYEVLGTSPMVTVPFAFMAQTCADVDDADADPDNEIQTLSINGNTLSISNGNSVDLPTGGGDTVDDEELAKSWCSVDILGNSNVAFDAHNVISTSKISTGVYLVQFPAGLFSVATNPAMVCTIHNDLAPGVAIPTYGASPSQVTVRTYDMNGNLSDRGFNLVVFGK